MLFEQKLNDISLQYYFVKHPSEFIESVCYDELPSIETFKDTFKSTKIYKTLSLDINDGNEKFYSKKGIEKIYVEILQAAGLAIISTFLSDIDKFLNKPIQEANDSIINYLMNKDYMTTINNFLPADESPLDFISFSIDEAKMDRNFIESLWNVKKYYLDIAKMNQSEMKSLKYDCNMIKGFNYNLVKTWIQPFYADLISAMYDYDLDSIDYDDKSSNNKNANPKVKKKEQNIVIAKEESENIHKNEHKILTVEDAIEKNFNGLIGLTDVKKAILRKTKLIQKLPTKAVDCNFRIVGNPGVGKTTVAEAMSGTFYDAGIIKNPEFVVLNGAGLKGKYVGHTVGQVKEIFKKANGGTLFLDEVYSLLSSDGNEDSFTQEAITQLMLEVENLYKLQQQDPSNKTLVIMAGYKDKIDMLLNKNVGFARRFSNIIDIKDYSLEELEAIFNMLMEKDGFKMTKQADKKLKEVLEQQRKKPNFSNAGYVRNLLQKVEEYQAERSEIDDLTINEEDIAKSSIDLEIPERQRMGF